uniref:C-type lectin domain-containing protein n=1 Tax=Periophthalmus magnuspinnatus TaxID=409849 RepID=A0A3B4A6A2_9GOBI
PVRVAVVGQVCYNELCCRHYKSFYYSSNIKRTWEESRRYCQEQGADLIVINSKEEQDFVEIFEGRSWIGLSDKETEGVWKWVDGSPLTISSWMSGEPNDEFGEDCVERRRDNNGKWTFNDLSCTQKRESIREIKLGSVCTVYQ